MINDNISISEFIHKLRKEGIDKGKKAEFNLIKKAQLEASKIILKAKEEAKNIILFAEEEKVFIRKQFSIELKMAFRDFILSFSEKIKQRIMIPVIRHDVYKVLNDINFFKECLFFLIKEHVKSKNVQLEVKISKEFLLKLNQYFSVNISERISIKDKVFFSSKEGIEGFILFKKGSNYYWDFTVSTVVSEILKLIDPSFKKHFLNEINISDIL